jgi:membrane glycosyltransferase
MSIETNQTAPHLKGIALTPTGTQSAEVLTLRRLIVAGLNIVLYVALARWAWVILATGGWSIIDVLLFICFLLGTPWAVLGFWNAVIGLFLLHGYRLLGKGDRAMQDVAPFADLPDPDMPVTLKTAIFMTLRNEDPSRAFRRLRLVKETVDATGFGEKFAYFLLSDTNRDDVGAEEERLFAEWRQEAGESAPLYYRRRSDNTGFKAGNVRDFLERWGSAYDLMLPLDADSLMDGATILNHVRIMEANPKLGILQSLVVGMPSQSLFARVFQFGMRQGMRSYTMGQAWWVGDCGPFWGHNALARIAPFRDHCELPVLPGPAPFGGHILSHDQVEATFMRRAGYEVRVMPLEGGSWEENPPTILEFMKRNTRWCQGNLQYFKLLNTKGLYPLPADLGHPDVPRHSCLDADAAARRIEAFRRRVAGDFPGCFGARPLHHLHRDEPDAENCRPHRYSAHAWRHQALWRHGEIPVRGPLRDRVCLGARRVRYLPHHDFHHRPALRQERGLGRAGA